MKWQAYRNSEPKAQPPKLFSHQEALESIRRTLAELNESGPWPENLTAWLNFNHKETVQAIKIAEKGIDHAFLSQDAETLEKALAEYKRACVEGLTLWREREQQPSMLAAHRR